MATIGKSADGAPASAPVLRLIAFDRRWYLAGAAGWLLFHAWPLVPGLLGLAFFDVLQGHAPAGFTLTTVLALTAAAGLARIAVVFGAAMTSTRWRFAARSLVQHNVLARIMRLPGARSVPQETGRAISTLRDDAEAISMMGDWTFDATSALVFGASSMAILLTINARVTVLVMPPLILVIAIAHQVRGHLERFRARSRAATADVTATIGDLAHATRAIQAAGREATVVAHLRRQGDDRKRAALRDELLGASLDAVFTGLASLGTGLVLLVAAGQIRSGRFTIGDFVLFSTYLLQLSEYTGFIGYLAKTRRQASVSFRRATELMQGAPMAELVAHHPLHLRRAAPGTATMPARDAVPLQQLRVTGLSYVHESGRGVHDIELDVRRGDLTVVTGRIGAGKTTLLRALLGQLPAQDGTVLWNETRVEDPPTFMTPPRVGYTPQSPSLLSARLRDNVLLGLPLPEQDRETLDLAIRRSALERDVAALPDGLDTQIGVNGLRLSGGQVLRTAAARMLVRRPDLLVIDDLSSGLDVETERELWRRILTADATCLVVSHRRAVLARADHVIVLKDGRVAGRGTLPELMENCREMQELMTMRAAS